GADLAADVGNFLTRFRGKAPKASVKILFVAAERGTDLDLKAQYEALRIVASKRANRSKMSVIRLFNATPEEIVDAVSTREPTIVHLSGVQNGDGTILLHNSRGALIRFDADRLARIIARSKSASLKLVVLDTCYSMDQAKKLTQLGLPYAIG